MPLAEQASNASAGLRYDELHRRAAAGGWRVAVGIPLLVLGFLVGQAVMGLVVSAALMAGGVSSDELRDRLSGDITTPSYLALVNLGWAIAIPIVFVVAWCVHRQTPGWVTSVVGRFRWRWFLVCLAAAVVALGLTLAASSVLPDQGSGTTSMAGGLNPWTSTVRDFLLVILLLTPLQAAGEEYVFRGYLAQGFGGVAARFGGRVSATVAVVVPALLFALAHGIGQDVPIFFDRFAFGLVAGVLVILTGGLEAGIAMHVLNNFLAFGMALAFGDMTEALHATDGTWWAVPVTLVQSLSYLGLTVLAARRMGIATRTGQGAGGAILASRGAPV